MAEIPSTSGNTVVLGAGEALLKNIQRRLASIDPEAVAAQIEKIRSSSLAASPRGAGAKRGPSAASGERAKQTREQQAAFNKALLAKAAQLGLKTE